MEVLEMQNCTIYDEALQYFLEKADKLVYLDIAGCFEIGDETISFLAKSHTSMFLERERSKEKQRGFFWGKGEVRQGDLCERGEEGSGDCTDAP
jgi:hypothetical protein